MAKMFFEKYLTDVKHNSKNEQTKKIYTEGSPETWNVFYRSN